MKNYNKALKTQHTPETLNKYSLHLYEKTYTTTNDHQKKVLYEYLKRHKIKE